MSELERALTELGGRLDLPPTPDLAAAVAERIVVAAPRRPARTAVRALAVALAILLVGVGTAFAVPQSRHAILEWLGLEGVTIERVPVLPQVPGTASLSLGTPVTPAEAQAEVEFPILVPAALGFPEARTAPSGIYVDRSVPGGKLSLVYAASGKRPAAAEGVGMLVTEFRGELDPGLMGKLVAEGAIVEPVTAGGAAGAWIEGAHVFFYRDRDGEIREQTVRLAGNVLLLERDGVLVRIESALAKAEALRIAASLEPAGRSG